MSVFGQIFCEPRIMALLFFAVPFAYFAEKKAA